MSLKDWALIFGIVAVVLAGVLLFGGIPGPQGPDSGLTVSTLPRSIAGFTLQEYLERVEPVLPGEQYSAVAFFTPADRSSVDPAVERLGIMLYHFDSPENVTPALNLVSLGNVLQALQVDEVVVKTYMDEAAGQVNVFWAQGTALVQILIAADANKVSDFSSVQQTALDVMSQVIRAQRVGSDAP